MSTSHLDRKELKRPDAFLETAGSVVDFINENAKAIILVLGLLFALGLGVAFYNNMSAKNAEQAESAFYEARKVLAEELAKSAPKPAEGAQQAATPADWKEKAKDGIARVEQVAKQHGGTRAAFDAYMLLGDVHFVRKDAAKASEYYQQALANATPRSAKPTAQYALGYAFEDLKDYDKAIDAMRQVVGSSDAVLKPDAMLALGRELGLKGEKIKAVDIYNQVLKEFPNTPAARAAEYQINQLK